MDKQPIFDAIIAALQDKLEVARSSTQRAIDAATDEETIPEHKYDTLALEASYLAHGQAMRVQACEAELASIQLFQMRDYSEQAVGVGAYVELENDEGMMQCFFIAPCAGGLEVRFEERKIYLLTTQSPLGKQLKGAYEGDEVVLKMGDLSTVYQVVTVR
ncbi:GreA/GreB family elongation factor [Vibrio taketomensis]|uniref:GreA/GreB family elongation factor n=1 Tax=Vibrio taketomensis TaxID=2572923 RepID=UPI00138987A3|nr:GreA/GreB family elongation factor [Vibrio taketomensis]